MYQYFNFKCSNGNCAIIDVHDIICYDNSSHLSQQNNVFPDDGMSKVEAATSNSAVYNGK